MQEEQYSPIFSQYTQEDNQNIDVMWDWNSPQSKPRSYVHKVRRVQNSPKLPVKRHPSNNQIDVFNKLKEELETLKSDKVEHTDNKYDHALSSKSKENVNQALGDFDDFFDDSMEEELLICSQDVEQKLQLMKDPPLHDEPVNCLENFEPQDKVPKIEKMLFKDDLNKPKIENNNFPINGKLESSRHIKTINISEILNDKSNKIADDSFDFLLETFNDEELDVNNPTTTSDKNINKTNLHEQQNMKHLSGSTETLSQQCTAMEIEKKRKEALAKLESKKKHSPPSESESPIKCSPEEIEHKRQQAIAKLEAKKKQDIIEKNRQEALKRLQMNKRKRALQKDGLLPK